LPVTPRRFFTSEHYVANPGAIWPALVNELCEINSGRYQELVATGGIGAGKTSISLFTIMYQLYLVLCMRSPHEEFGLDPAHEIVVIFQSRTARLANDVVFSRFYEMVATSQWFQRYAPHDPDLRATLRFLHHRLEVGSVSGQATAALGRNVIFGILSEVNDMLRVEKSRQVLSGGEYDQVWALYNAISRRRKTRFAKNGRLPGVMCLDGSRKYPGEFTDLKEQEARTDPTIYVYSRRAWEVKPVGTFSEQRFLFFAGDPIRLPHVIEDGERVMPGDQALVHEVPVDFLQECRRDPVNASRDILGIATLARHPFFRETEAVAACFGRVRSIVSHTEVDLESERIEAYPDRVESPEEPRWAHIDVGLTGDALGLVVGHCAGFVPVSRGNRVEVLPRLVVDFALRVVPPRRGEIQLWRVRQMLLGLRDLGLPLQWVSLDSFQSADTIQLLRQEGLRAGVISADRDEVSYRYLKAAIYDHRLEVPEHPWLLRELLALEQDPVKAKIDHPASGSKDVADALACMVRGLHAQPELWSRHDVDVRSLHEEHARIAPAGDRSITAGGERFSLDTGGARLTEHPLQRRREEAQGE
jgi:hypothetical protein